MKWKSSRSRGPDAPALRVFWLSATFTPVEVVSGICLAQARRQFRSRVLSLTFSVLFSVPGTMGSNPGGVGAAVGQGASKGEMHSRCGFTDSGPGMGAQAGHLRASPSQACVWQVWL